MPLAGWLGVAIFDRMTAVGFVTVGSEGATLTPDGEAWGHQVGLALDAPLRSRRPFIRLCLD